jgi:hypothetical protein
VAHPFDRIERFDGPQDGVMVEDGDLGHRRPHGTLRAAMGGNGKQRPARPRIELRQSPASPEEAAAIAAAIEQFLRDTAPRPKPARERMSPWLRAALHENAGLDSGSSAPWA